MKISNPCLYCISRILTKTGTCHEKIILFTARGAATGIDWKELTKKQLKDWNVKHHELIFGKPHADVFIDDKAQDIFNWFN